MPRSASFIPAGPTSLKVAAGVVGVQGAATLVFGLAEAVHLANDRLVMGTTTSLFFAAYGVGLLLCAGGLLRLQGWSRSPVVLAELIWLGLAWNFRGGSTGWLSAVLLVTAVATLACLLNPTAMQALEADGATAED